MLDKLHKENETVYKSLVVWVSKTSTGKMAETGLEHEFSKSSETFLTCKI